MKEFKLEDFPSKTFDKIRYVDTDRQGHVNNSVFSSFLETGRVEILYNADLPILSEGLSFVIVSLKLDFYQEITWPGRVDIGTGIVKVGGSSITIYQRLFQYEKCVAQAETVIVQVDNDSRRSFPLSDAARQTFGHWLIGDGAVES
ncbi:MAG: acyl-CoA thioesterase [Chloroflexi bacterium]|nr:acyl-CoA thioesterase [Chloroflexota bacterium]MBP7041246.1 acyl-CoA thioesterase [Chloroflexota bacterium]